MKKSLKILCSLLTACAVLTSSNVCFAKNTDVSASKESIKISAYEKSDNVTLDKIDTGDIVEFASDGKDSSHQFVVDQALNILNNDKGYATAKYLLNHKDTIVPYADMPDTDEKDYVFAYHFYNPYTGRNYLPNAMSASLETALVRFVRHAETARDNYNSNREYAMEELGRACHYLADANEPHHAANLIAGISYHSQFESFVDQKEQNYKVATSNKYNDHSSSSYSEYCTLICDDAAKFAYGYKDLANASKGLLKGGDKEKWDIAGRAVMKNAQESIAAFLYNFIKNVESI